MPHSSPKNDGVGRGDTSYDKGKWAVRIAKKSIERIKAKSKKITERSNGSNTKEKLLKMRPLIEGWMHYFSIANAKSIMQELDKCVRTSYEWGYGRSGKIVRPEF